MPAEAAEPHDAWSRAGLWLEVAIQRKARPWWERAGRIALGILILPVSFLAEVPEAAAAPVAWSRYRVLLRTRSDRAVLREWDMGGDGIGARDLERRLLDDLDRLDVEAFSREWDIVWRPG
jgi:hypothetical protein